MEVVCNSFNLLSSAERREIVKLVQSKIQNKITFEYPIQILLSTRSGNYLITLVHNQDGYIIYDIIEPTLPKGHYFLLSSGSKSAPLVNKYFHYYKGKYSIYSSSFRLIYNQDIKTQQRTIAKVSVEQYEQKVLLLIKERNDVVYYLIDIQKGVELSDSFKASTVALRSGTYAYAKDRTITIKDMDGGLLFQYTYTSDIIKVVFNDIYVWILLKDGGTLYEYSIPENEQKLIDDGVKSIYPRYIVYSGKIRVVDYPSNEITVAKIMIPTIYHIDNTRFIVRNILSHYYYSNHDSGKPINVEGLISKIDILNKKQYVVTTNKNVSIYDEDKKVLTLHTIHNIIRGKVLTILLIGNSTEYLMKILNRLLPIPSVVNAMILSCIPPSVS